MAPASLREANTRVVENAYGAAQKIGQGHEVGVEDRDERGAREGQAVSERARLETLAGAAPDVGDVDSFLPPVGDAPARDERCLVVRVVEDLHLEPFPGPIHLAYGIDDAFGDVAFVVDRDLHADVVLISARDHGARTVADPG